MIKKLVLGTGIVATLFYLSAVAEAKTYTLYCVPYAMSNEATNVSTWFSMTVEDWRDACNKGCEHEWADYLEANYKNWFELHRGMLGPYDSASKAKKVYYKQKARAQEFNVPFHHASDFSCSGH